MNFSPLCTEYCYAMNDAAPVRSSSAAECDMSGLLEDLKFRNIQDASKSCKKPRTSRRSADYSKKGSPPRLSIRKVLGTRLRDSFQRKSISVRSSGSWDSLSSEVLDEEFDDMALNFQEQPSEMSVSKREETLKNDTSASKLCWRSDSEIV
jgi:hypothetical protein